MYKREVRFIKEQYFRFSQIAQTQYEYNLYGKSVQYWPTEFKKEFP